MAGEGEQADGLLGAAESYRRQAELERARGRQELAKRLDTLADEIESGLVQNALAWEKERRLLSLREYEASTEHGRTWYLENTRQVIGLAQASVRNVILINAGAAVAIIAFMADTWAAKLDVGEFARGLAVFASGVLLGALASALSYLTQLMYGSVSEKQKARAPILHKITIGVGLLALVMFGVGCLQTFTAFQGRPMSTVTPSQHEQRNFPPPTTPQKLPSNDSPLPRPAQTPSNPANSDQEQPTSDDKPFDSGGAANDGKSMD